MNRKRASPNKPLKTDGRTSSLPEPSYLSPVVEYHGLAYPDRIARGFLMRPLLNGGTLGGRGLATQKTCSRIWIRGPTYSGDGSSMTLDQLEAKLNLLGVHPRSYSLDGSYKDEATILAQEGAGWVVYYSERGQRSGLTRFSSLGDACEHALNQLATDPLSRVGPDPEMWATVAKWKPWWKFW